MVSMISSSCQEQNRRQGRTFWAGFQKTEGRTSQFWAFRCSWGKTTRAISGAASFSVHMQILAYLKLYSGCASILILMRYDQHPWILTYIHMHVTNNLPWWQARTLALLIPFHSQNETTHFFFPLNAGLWIVLSSGFTGFWKMVSSCLLQ